MAYVQIRNISQMQVPVYAHDGSSAIIQPNSTATLNDKFLFSLDYTKLRVLNKPGVDPYAPTVIAQEQVAPVVVDPAMPDPNGLTQGSMEGSTEANG